jgi:hypothetical protein
MKKKEVEFRRWREFYPLQADKNKVEEKHGDHDP